MEETKIEIIERFYPGEKTEGRLMRVGSKIERIVLFDGKEMYRQTISNDCRAKSKLDEFINWLFGSDAKESSNSSQVSND